MAKITWLGEDSPGVAGPSFTTAFGQKFPKGEAVEVTDKDMIERARKNQFFDVSDDGRKPGRPTNEAKAAAEQAEAERLAAEKRAEA